MSRPLWTAIFLLALPTFGSAADEGIPAEKLQQLKAATVYVKVEGKVGMATGSGFLMHVDGETGLVVTNRHVIAAIPGLFTPKSYSLVFHSGTPKEQVRPAEVIAVCQEQDLAVLKATIKDPPKPFDLAPAKLRETMTMYTLGFPLGGTLSEGRRNPAVTIGKGTIGALPQDDQGKLRHVQLDGELNSGNSGGPIVDGEGKLVGIAVSKIPGTKISFAIPPAELTEMLKGSAGAVEIRTLRVEKDTAELEVEVPLIDPMGYVKKVDVLFVNKDAAKAAPDKDASGAWPKLASAESVTIPITNGKATAKIKIAGGAKKLADFYLQSQYALADGKPDYTKAVLQPINFSHQGLIKLDAAPPWITITSKAIGFSVDMPTKPQIIDVKKTKIGGLNLSTLELGCVTENGIYIVDRYELPAAPKSGTESKLMDAFKDYFVKEWEGKVTSEKNVTSSWKKGSDFTIQSKLSTKTTLNSRARIFHDGKMVYLISVLSLPNADLPEDTGRFLGSLSVGDPKPRSAGTPEVDYPGTELKGWGLAIDPDNDCKFTPNGKSLSIQVPGKLHDLFFDGGPTNAPRVMQDVEGDFVATVKVGGEFKLGPKSTNPQTAPYLGAGLLVFSNSDNMIRCERCMFGSGARLTTGLLFEEREGGYQAGSHSSFFKLDECYVRLERKGSTIYGGSSTDGKTWKDLKPIDTVYPKKVKIGLHVISTSNQPFTAKFEDFTVKTK
jgi:S1-C subfamily serine protease/regulation of enolase protein 1 (concanavalin A-like superfamily)